MRPLVAVADLRLCVPIYFTISLLGRQLHPHPADSLRSRARVAQGCRCPRDLQGGFRPGGCQEADQEGFRGEVPIWQEQVRAVWFRHEIKLVADTTFPACL